jgi:CHAT domain-containing protein
MLKPKNCKLNIVLGLLLVFFSCFSVSFAQNTKENLVKLWSDSINQDSVRVEAISTLIWKHYLFTKPDTAMLLAYEYLYFTENKNLIKNKAEALNILGVASSLLGDSKKAVQYYKEGLQIGEEIQDKYGIASSYNNLGMLYGKTADYDLAIYYLKKNIEINEELGDRKITSALNNLGMVYTKTGEYSYALQYLKKSLQLKEFYNDYSGMASTLLNIGNVYVAQGNHHLANQYFQRCAEHNLKQNDQLGYAAVMMSIGTNHRNNYNYEEAISCFLISQSIQESIGDKKGLGSALNNLGVCFKDLGQYDKSLDYYKKSLAIKESLNDKQGIANTWCNIASVYFEIKDFSLALNYVEKSNELAKKINASAQIKSSLRLMYQIYLARTEYKLAYVYLKELIDIRTNEIQLNYFTLSENDKLKYLSTLTADFGLLYDYTSYMSEHESDLVELAFNLALKTKGLTLRSTSLIRKSIQESNDTTLVHHYEEWIMVKNKIIKEFEQGKNIQELQLLADDLEESLTVKSLIFKEIKESQYIDWKKLQRALGRDELVIEFVNFKSEINVHKSAVYGAFVLTKESQKPEFVLLCKEEELEKLVSEFKGDNLLYSNYLYSRSSALYQLVWKPLEKYTYRMRKLHISPTGLLNKISFAALRMSNGMYLCQQHDIQLYNSTIQLVGKQKEIIQPKEVFMVFGGIQYDTKESIFSNWKYLQGTLHETEKISQFVKRKKYDLIYATGNEATEKQFKSIAPNVSIIHLATHGFFYPDSERLREMIRNSTFYQEEIKFRGSDFFMQNSTDSLSYAYWNFVRNNNPMMRSGIVLSGANEVWSKRYFDDDEDGVLTALEVSNLDLRKTKLIVLSACETGLGDIFGNEGVFGLQRAFKMAGVKSLIMSLWQVPDKETSEFMELFYTHLFQFNDISLSFRKTQLAMSKKYDPFYWAAFVLLN